MAKPRTGTVTLTSKRGASYGRQNTIYSGKFVMSEYARLLGLADAVAETSDPARRSNAKDRAWRVLGDACGYTSDSWPVVRSLERLPTNLMTVRAGMGGQFWEGLAECDAQLVALVRFALGLDFATTQVEDARRRPPLIRGISQAGEGFGGMTLENWFEHATKEGATDEMLAEVARGWPEVRAQLASLDPATELERMGAAIRELSS